MALQDTNQTSAAPVTQQAPQQAAQQPQAAGNNGRWSFHGAGLLAAPISRGVGSEFYGTLKNNLTEIFKGTNDGYEVALIDLDNVNEPALNFSAIIVAMRKSKQADAAVAYHLLILEATGDRIVPIFDTIGNQQVEIYRVPGDAMDDVLVSMAQAKVRKAFPVGPWFFTDGTVVPEGFDPKDKFAVHRLALNAGLAVGTEIETHTAGFSDMNLAGISNDSTLNITIGFNRQQIADAVGAPMRSDLLLSFASKKNSGNQRNASVNSGDKEVKISELSGFIDLVWDPVAPAGSMNAYIPQQNVQTQKYAARVVITNLASNYSYTPGSTLLGIASVLSLRDDNNWIQGFRSTASAGNEIDMGDIGALNIEANLLNDPSGYGIRVDTKTDSFRLEDLGQYVAATVRPGLIVSLDCPVVGPQSWYTAVYPAAANGSNPAYQIIYDAAMTLTNGNFQKYFPVGSLMFTDIGNRVHMGTWVDRSGNKRDIRDIDHLAVCNLVGERNPQLIREFSDTFLNTRIPLPMRLSARKKMIIGLTNETATITGYADRVTFTAAFLDALSKGIKDTGLGVRVNTPLTGSDFNNQRGVASFAGSALLVPGQSFMSAGNTAYMNNFVQPGMYGNYRF